MTMYYFAAAGDDLNDGLSEATPKRTLQEATFLSALLLPGDALVFNKGDRFFGTLLPKASGTKDEPITFGAYGTGPNPVIDGSEQIDLDWRRGRERHPYVYFASWAPQDTNRLRRLFIDGEEANPREDILEDVNSPGDWLYEQTEKRVYLYSKDGNPGDIFSEFRGSSMTNCIRIENPTDIIVEGIDCTRANNKGIKATGDSLNIQLRDLVISRCGSTGYLQTGSAHNTRLIRVRSIQNGLDILDHGFYMGKAGSNGRFYMEDCEASGNAGYGIHIYRAEAGGDIIRPVGGGNSKRDIIVSEVAGSVRIIL